MAIPETVSTPAVNTKDNLIVGSHINKKFFLETETTHVLKDLNFVVPKNSFTIIYGPSGSGKSTLLNALVGLEPPTDGKFIIDGQDLYALNTDQRANFRARTLGMVYQTNYWVNSLDVVDNVSMPLFLSGYSRKQANMIAKETLEMVGMANLGSKRPTVLSGGQQQRVSMARALVANPSWVVADEPTGNLDTKNGDMIMNLLNDLKQKMNKTVILVTHNLEYLSISDHRLQIKDGVLTESSGRYGLGDKEKESKLNEFKEAIANAKAKKNSGVTTKPSGAKVASLADISKPLAALNSADGESDE